MNNNFFKDYQFGSLFDNSNKEPKDYSFSDSIKNFIESYNFEDVIRANFIISSWLPNRSSCLKLYIINTITLNYTQNKSISLKSIKTYREFKEYYKNLIKCIPNLQNLEDCIPEGDLGEVTYYFNNKNYQIFYNGNCSNQYEYYNLFEIIYSFTKQKQAEYGFDFYNDFESLLKYQDKIINIIKKFNNQKEIPNPGFIEIPDYNYWNYLNNNFYKLILPQTHLFNKWAHTKSNDLDDSTIVDAYMNCEEHHLFAISKEYLLPVFSRNPLIYIFNDYEKYIKNIPVDNLYKNIKLNLSKYMHKRFSEDIIYLVQSYDYDKKNINGELIYDFGMVIEESLYLFFTSKIEDDNSLYKIIENEKNIIEKNKGCFFQYLNFDLKKEIFINVNFKKIEFINIKTFFNLYTKTLDFSPEIFKKENIKTILYIFDEIEDLIEYEKYEKFSLNYSDKISLLTDREDLFATFKIYDGEIIKGNECFNSIFISPHSADKYRYQQLKKKCNLIKYIPYNDPCTWKIKKDEKKIFLFNKITNDFNIVINIKNTVIRIKNSYSNNKKEFQIVDFISQIISYNFEKLEPLLKNEKYFSTNQEILIDLFPDSIINKKEFFYLKHLKTDDKWKMDLIKFKDCSKKKSAIRILINTNETFKFYNDNKRKEEERLIVYDIFKTINLKSFPKIKKEWNKTNSDQSEFRFNLISSAIDTPKFYKKFNVSDDYFIKARKDISLLLNKDTNIKEGIYKEDDALKILIKIRTLVLEKFKKLIALYDKSIIEYFLTELNNTFFHSRVNQLKFKQNNKNCIKNDDIVDNIKNTEEHSIFTFIIENKLFLNNYGDKKIVESKAKYIYAFAKWIVVDIYNTIELLTYDINKECTLHVENNNLFFIKQSEEYTKKIDKWKEYITNCNYKNQDISNVIEESDRKNLITDLNKLFLEKFKFTYEHMLYTCNILAQYNENQDIIITIEKENLINYILKTSILDKNKLESFEIENIINYLELEYNYLDTILSNSKLIHKGFINYGETNKRPYRLIIKPFIKINNIFYISRELCFTTFNANLRHLENGKLPYRSEFKKIQARIDQFAKNIQDQLVEKTYLSCLEIGYDKSSLEKERELYKLDKSGQHPRDLGDYDLLIFDENKNTIFNVECKYISQSFTAKDLKNDVDKIFGITKNPKKTYIYKFMRRQEYLQKNSFKICQNIGYKFKPDINVIPIFLTYTSNFFLKNPIIETPIIYLTLNEFKDFLTSYKI